MVSMPANGAMAAGVRTSASVMDGAIPTRGQGGVISGWAFNRSSAVTCSAVARASGSVSTFSSSQREETVLAAPILRDPHPHPKHPHRPTPPGINHLDGTYEGGHLVGTQFGGPPERLNMVLQLDGVNRGVGGPYSNSVHSFEMDAARNPGKYTDIDISVEYGPHLTGTDVDKVPERIIVKANENGSPMIPKNYNNR